MAQNSQHWSAARHPHALFHHGSVLLWRLQTREAASKPPPGKTTVGAAGFAEQMVDFGGLTDLIDHMQLATVCVGCQVYMSLYPFGCIWFILFVLFRPKGIILEPTRMNSCQTPVISSTPTGQATEEMSLLHPTMLKQHSHFNVHRIEIIWERRYFLHSTFKIAPTYLMPTPTNTLFQLLPIQRHVAA